MPLIGQKKWKEVAPESGKCGLKGLSFSYKRQSKDEEKTEQTQPSSQWRSHSSITLDLECSEPDNV